MKSFSGTSKGAKHMKKIFLLSMFVLTLASPLCATEKVYVFAAASMTNAVEELIDVFQRENVSTAEFKTSFTSSSTLARQIDAGADANIYISANMKWFRWLEGKGLIDKDSTSILAANALVLIAAPGNGVQLASIEALPAAIGQGYLAMGDHTHVPAGMYAREALDHYKLWDKIKPRLALYPSVRVALNAVDKAQADFGIVYKTDALAAPRCRLVYTFDQASHSPIRYPAAAIQGKNDGETRKFLHFLKSDIAEKVLEKYGFVLL